jgi:hypothetical protein
LLEVSLVEDTNSMVLLTAAKGKDYLILCWQKILNSIPLWKICCNVSFHKVYSSLVGSAGSSGEPKQNNVSINGIAHSDQESASESKLTDVSCNPVGEQVEAQGKLICDCQFLL